MNAPLVKRGEALPSVEKAWELLKQTRSSDDVRKIRAIAQAVATAERGRALGIDAAEIVAWADRRAGELSKDLDKAPRGGKTNRGKSNSPKSGQLKQLGMSRQRAAEKDAYRIAIPGLDKVVSNDGDCRTQRLGIDDVLLMRDGTLRRVQKKQRRPPADGADITLEVVHEFDDGHRKAGWVEEDLRVDFFGYGLPHIGRAYIFPWASLRAAWLACGHAWRDKARESWKRGNNGKRGTNVDGFYCLRTRNDRDSGKGYYTWSVAVPTFLLLDAVISTIVVEVPPRPMPVES